MFEHESRLAANYIKTASDDFRALARKAAPGIWSAVPGEHGTTRLLARNAEEIAVVTGVWAPTTARYLTVLAPDTAYLVAELMWLSADEIRKGALPTRLRTATLELAKGITKAQAPSSRTP
ncbi:hypothetical protein JOF56_000136 [Kibdelosporangium banguiense]|uniref:Uncharacterized protein n=1 Tax=Kibdelosporangium banguiense TaxID=1365924 RepID=A0ABS4T796_9PSEU|nr:hypothetical protein [Kibdelosporangium banguiense]MBP2319751.1 hypothetical protein [Kibdelosporangium banguiense]